MMEGSMLEIKGLSCGYGKRIVLHGVSFAIKKGEFVGVIGPNGSGKTTLLRAITGFLPPQGGTSSRGTISLEGEEPRHMGRRTLAQRVAVVTQAPDIMPPFSVEEFVLLGRVPHWRGFQLLETAKDREIAERAMEMAGIESLKERRMGELSGGERQLVFVARALAQTPHLLLLDEPTAHLDIGHQVQIMDLLQELNREGSLTILVVLHDLTLAGLYCKRLILLNEGRLRAIGPPQEVLTKGVIEEVYQTQVTVMETPAGGRPVILPVAGKNQ